MRGQRHAPAALYPRKKNPVPIVQEVEWAPGSVWTGAENLAPTEIRSPDRPACSQSLYQLRYPVLRDGTIMGNSDGMGEKFVWTIVEIPEGLKAVERYV